jgi:hypothetical protein
MSFLFQGAGTNVAGVSTAAQSTDNVDVIVWSKRNRQIPRLFFIDENSDVLSNRVLFGDDAKADARIAPIQRPQDIGNGLALGRNFALLFGVRTKRTGDVNCHGQNSAASIE